MLHIKVTFPGDAALLSRQMPNGDGIFGNCIFYINNDDILDCDYWVVLYDLTKKEIANCPPENTVFVTGEPISVKKYNNKFLSQFAKVITSQDSLIHSNTLRTHQLMPWFVQKTYDDLVKMSCPEKSNLISIVSSDKRFSKGHEQRYQFAKAMKEHFGDRLDLYGRGIRDFDDKWDVLAPYKYSVVIENSSSKYYVTEKLDECFLSYTFPFYYGCTNLDDYYPNGSYEYIDITDVDGSLSIIEKVLQDSNHYQKHFDKICEARMRYLDEYQVFSKLVNIVNSLETEDKSDSKEIVLKPATMGISDLWFKVKCLWSILKNIINK